MKEQTQAKSIDEQIAALEEQMIINFDSASFRKLIFLRISKYQKEGLLENEAKKKAYTEAKAKLKKDEQRWGTTPTLYALTWQFDSALMHLNLNKPDPLDKEVHGIKLATLNLAAVSSLQLDNPEKYQDIAKALTEWERNYGNYAELTEMINQLGMKADFFSNPNI